MTGAVRLPGPLVALPPVTGGIDLDLPGRDVRLRATRWPGPDPVVLLLHGLASSRRFWDLVVPRLVGPAAGPGVLALDQRGHGDSDRPAGPYDGGSVVADVLTALDALGLSRVVVVGHSWGAWTALRLAASAPERVLAVVALDGGLGTPRSAGATRAEARKRLTPPRLALPAQQLTALLRGGPLAPWWSPAVEAAILPLFALGADGLARARLPFEAHMAIVDDLLDGEGPDLASISCPAWLVSCEPVGPADTWSAGKAAALDRAGTLLARPRLLRWAGAVHDVPLQWPELVAGLIRAAAQEVGAGAPGAGPAA